MPFQNPPSFSTTIRVVVLALAFWLGREVTIPSVIVSQIGLPHAATVAVIVTRIGFGLTGAGAGAGVGAGAGAGGGASTDAPASGAEGIRQT